MKKIILITVLVTQFSFAKNTDGGKKINSNSEKKSDSVVQCCTRRAVSGTYGKPEYDAVSVTRCAISEISYQDAQAKACAAAAISAQKALEISQTTSYPFQLSLSK